MKYYENESRFNDVYSRGNLPNKIKDVTYVINLDEYFDIGTHWIALYVKNSDITYFDSFGVEHIPKEIKAFIEHRNIKTNIFRIQAYDSIMCGYFCIAFIDFMFKGKTLTEDFNDIDVYYLGYEYKKKITECNIIKSVNPIYFRIGDRKGQFEKGKDDAWYLVISDKDDVYKRLLDILESIKIKLQKKHGML